MIFTALAAEDNMAEAISEKRRREAYRNIKSSPSYGEYLTVLKSEEEKLRTIYETQPASEYNRGRLNGLQLVISEIEGL